MIAMLVYSVSGLFIYFPAIVPMLLDCINFQLQFPNCNQTGVEPSKLADGICDENNNYEGCNYDGGGK